MATSDGLLSKKPRREVITSEDEDEPESVQARGVEE
jgi:hypothetical protein